MFAIFTLEGANRSILCTQLVALLCLIFSSFIKIEHYKVHRGINNDMAMVVLYFLIYYYNLLFNSLVQKNLVSITFGMCK